MSKYQIALIIGSLRKDSFNRKLANAIVKLAFSEFSSGQLCSMGEKARCLM
jgi:chromate reductase